MLWIFVVYGGICMDRKIGLGAGFINQLMGVLYGIHAPTNGITIVNVVNHGKPNAINHPPDDIFYGWYCINYPQDSPSAIHITMFFWKVISLEQLYGFVGTLFIHIPPAGWCF